MLANLCSNMMLMHVNVNIIYIIHVHTYVQHTKYIMDPGLFRYPRFPATYPSPQFYIQSSSSEEFYVFSEQRPEQQQAVEHPNIEQEKLYFIFFGDVVLYLVQVYTIIGACTRGAR